MTHRQHVNHFHLPSIEAESYWLSLKIKELIESGVKPSEIAVLLPRHKYLENLIAYFLDQDISINYERRADIFVQEHIDTLLKMAEYILSLDPKQETKEELLPGILSHPMWQIHGIQPGLVWKLTTTANDNRKGLLETMLETPKFDMVAKFFINCSQQFINLPITRCLDILIGHEDFYITQSSDEDVDDADLTALKKNSNQDSKNSPEELNFKSPFKTYYTTRPKVSYSYAYTNLLSDLQVLYSHLQDNQALNQNPSFYQAISHLIDMRSMGEKLINNANFNQSLEGVWLMTVFKSKGLEFEHVFIPHFNENVWFPKRKSSKLKPPANLASISSQAETKDDDFRLIYVALTRAKNHLYTSTYTNTIEGRQVTSMTTNDKAENIDYKPQEMAKILRISQTENSLYELTRADENLLKNRLKDFKLSATNLITYLNIWDNGPWSFVEQSLLKFPRGRIAEADYGSLIHNCLQQYVNLWSTSEQVDIQKVLNNFEYQASQRFHPSDLDKYKQRGKDFLQSYLGQLSLDQNLDYRCEFSFRNHDVQLGQVPLTGQLDRLDLDNQNKLLKVVDYKTGKPFTTSQWLKVNNLKSWKYRRQMLFYKILIEESGEFESFDINSGAVEFVEAGKDDTDYLFEITFASEEIDRMKLLIQAVYQKIINLEFPSQSNTFSQINNQLERIMAFEDWLIESL
jgi:DNA helicase-2/ATP-dependent DNA helicase PcrA